MLDSKQRYLQIAFNYNLGSAMSILPRIPKSERILVEAGTPFIKREGFNGIRSLAYYWGGYVVADLKTSDGAAHEVELARSAGASAATVMGSAPIETVNIFTQKCKELGIDSMIDMLGVEEPLKVMLKLKVKPNVVILHKGRDEESNKMKAIAYKQVNKVRSKYDVLISAAGGIGLKEARSAIFNGANIVVANIVSSSDPWTGISESEDIAEMAHKFLQTIE